MEDSFWEKSYITKVVLFVAFASGLIIRLSIIGKYGYNEDEILKVIASQEYRNLNFAENAQHPSLNKLTLTLSVIIFGENEFALRLPNAIFGAATVVPVYLIGKKLYTTNIGMIAAWIWSVNIPAIGFSTVAKEDSMLTFFWVLAVYAFLMSVEDQNYLKYVGICVGFALASKYTAVLLIFLLFLIYFDLRYSKISNIPLSRIIKYAMGYGIVTFLIVNFPIVFPDTLANLYDHYFQNKRINPTHHGFMMMGKLYVDRPWFYLWLYLLVKFTVIEVLSGIAGIIISFREHSYKERILLYWFLVPVIMFTIESGHTRYLMVVIPILNILSARCIVKLADFLEHRIHKLNKTRLNLSFSAQLHVVLTFLVVLNITIAGLLTSPYYRLYVNEFGGAEDRYGFYFPTDSVYDYMVREGIEYINDNAPINATVAMHHTIIGNYYGREDINFVFILDLPSNTSSWSNLEVNYVIIQDSRTYVENLDHLQYLRTNVPLEKSFSINGNMVVEIYKLV